MNKCSSLWPCLRPIRQSGVRLYVRVVLAGHTRFCKGGKESRCSLIVPLLICVYHVLEFNYHTSCNTHVDHLGVLEWKFERTDESICDWAGRVEHQYRCGHVLVHNHTHHATFTPVKRVDLVDRGKAMTGRLVI